MKTYMQPAVIGKEDNNMKLKYNIRAHSNSYMQAALWSNVFTVQTWHSDFSQKTFAECHPAIQPALIQVKKNNNNKHE